MIEKIQHATASSPEGAKGLVKGVLACAFQNMAFMLPTGLLYLLVKDLLAGSTSGRSTFYLLGCVACFALILLTTWFQYNGTYFTTYKESGTRRLTLAERLRKLPLSFFGKRDLADLTSSGICLAFPTKFGQWKSSPSQQSWKQRCLCPLLPWCSSWASHRWRSPARCCWCRAASTC